MGVVTLGNLHHDLKLGFVLVAAVALLELGDSRSNVAAVGALRFDPPMSLTWIGLYNGLGLLAVIVAAIWVDRRPPHTMMATGALVGVLGLTIVGLSNVPVAYALGVLIAWVGSFTVHSLVFYAIVAKGATRHRGALIGALGAIYSLSLNAGEVVEWSIDETWSIIATSAPFTLAGAALLFLLLPRVFAGASEADQTLRGKPIAPGLWKALVWVTLAFSVALAVRTAASLYLLDLMMRTTSGHEGPVLQILNAPVFIAISVLVWGIASDTFSVRLLLLLTALLLLLGASAYLAAGGLLAIAVGQLAIGLARGGLVCLPWILMAELLPTRHFAKLALLIFLVGGVSGGLLTGLFATILSESDNFFPFGVILVEGVALLILAILLPKQRSRGVQARLLRCGKSLEGRLLREGFHDLAGGRLAHVQQCRDAKK